MRDLLYIDGILVDLSDSKGITQTIKAWDIGDLRSRNANYTNRLSLPKTPVNSNTFQFPENDKSQSAKPYIKLPARLIQNGIETMSNGLAVIVDAGQSYTVELYSGIFSFFDAVSEKTLRDLNLNDFDSAGVTPKVLFPFIDYGTMDETDNPLVFVGEEYPSFPYKTLIEEIIKQNGYEKSGNVFNDSKLSALYLSGLGFKGYSDRFTRPKEFVARRDTSVIFNATGSFLKVNLVEVEGNESGWYDGANTYFPQDPQGGGFGGTWFLFEGYGYVDVDVVLVGAPSVELQIFSNTSGPYTVTLGAGNNKRNLEISARTSGSQPGLTGPISGIDGGEFYMRARTSTGVGTATLTFHEAVLWNKVLPDRVSTYTNATGLMPEFKQKDLLQDFFMRYGIIAKEGGLRTKVVAPLSTFTNLGAGAVNWVTGPAPTITINGFATTKQLHGTLNASGKCTISYDIDLTRLCDMIINILDSSTNLLQQFAVSNLPIGNNTGELEINILPSAAYISMQLNNNSASTCDVVVNEFTMLNQINSSTKVLILKTIKEIIEDKGNAIDWTTKRVDRQLTTSFKFRNYAQSNYLDFEDPDDIGDTYARGNIPVPNLNLPDTKSYFRSFFGISQTFKMGNEAAGYITAARIPVYEDGVETNDPGPRLTMVRDRRAPEPSLAGPGTAYKVAYTIDPVAPMDLGWEGFVNDNYTELIASLDKAKVVTHYYSLTEEDIQSFDIHKLIYDSGAYYIINTIDRYIPDLDTKVELFKVV